MRHVDVLEERDSLRNPMLGAVAIHAAIFGLLTASAIWKLGRREPWGDPNSVGGGAVGVSTVRTIPLPARSGAVNRLANDTKSQVPTPPKAEIRRRSRREDADAIALKTKRAKDRASREPASSPRTDRREYADNQLYSSAGQAAVSPVYGMVPGSGGVGVGTGTPFGARFGAYSALIRERVARQWRTDQVDPRIRTLPPAIVVFEISRSGQVGNVRVVQSSGNRSLDYSAERAVMQASPFEPLPAAYGGSSAVIEFWFQLQR